MTEAANQNKLPEVSVDLPAKIGADNTQIVHIVPAGRFQGRDGRGPYVLTDAEAVINETRRYHGKTEMLVDFEHHSVIAVKDGKKAPAAGWISALQAREDGIWAKVTWTAEAGNLIRQRAYRYLSPVFQHDRQGNVTRLLNVGLVNSPNLDLTAVARSEVLSMNEEQLADLRSLLGLSPDADFAAVRDAIAAMMQSANSTNPDPSKFVPIGDFERVVAEGNMLRKGIGRQEAEAHVSGLINRGALVPFLRDWAMNLCSINKPQLDAFIERTGPALTQIMSVQVKHPAYETQTAGTLAADELAICQTMGLTEAEFISARGGE
jgi:phage I-like protein